MLFRMRGALRAPLSYPPLTSIAAFFFFMVLVVVHRSQIATTDGLRLSPSRHWFNTSLLHRQANFWHLLFNDIERYGPKCDPVVHPEGGGLELSFNESDHRARPDNLRMQEGQLSAVRSAHAKFIRKLKERKYTLPYNKNTRGIVTTAGGPYLPVALVSIRMLRRTGSTLPVEVFLASKEEFDPQICGVVLPSLNARCIVLQDIFDLSSVSDTNVKIEKYQYKVMSIIFSSFEDVLFLDSDCFPIFDPDQLFDTDPFLATGMVLWPDFWFPSESPFFFEATEISAPPIYTRASTESGEILYSKSKHDLSMILATYYNYYGPEFYYPMQSQGAPGEGDKETFLWSAVALSEPFYTVKTRVDALGYLTTAGDWRGSAMLQFDPTQDLQTVQRHLYGQSAILSSPRPFFLHANFPKLNPATIFLDLSFGAAGPTRDADGTIRRIWYENSTTATALFGFDLERRLWEEIRDIACEYEGNFSVWTGETDICANATIYWQTLFENDMLWDGRTESQASKEVSTSGTRNGSLREKRAANEGDPELVPLYVNGLCRAALDVRKWTWRRGKAITAAAGNFYWHWLMTRWMEETKESSGDASGAEHYAQLQQESLVLIREKKEKERERTAKREKEKEEDSEAPSA